jgi:hypothetical protein
MKILIFVYYWPTLGRPGIRAFLEYSKLLSETGCNVVVAVLGDGKFPYRDEEILKGQLKQVKTYQISEDGLTDKLGLNHLTALNFSMAKGWSCDNFETPYNAVLHFNPDVIITTGPLYSTHFVGLQRKSLCEKKWLAHICNPWRKNRLC